ncbi:MAG: ATP synthase F1 subunit delta [Phycisphaerales bacterium]|nr:ATP synthase F1 subunit delta [Planctomycetota bacterium]MBL6996950.1 ATP synthase F1 subunit delta [Phycisphaerales bacterium]
MTCQTDALATVYAKSLFELASDAGGNDKIVEIADELEQVCELMRQSNEVRLFFASPIVDVPKRGEALSAIFSNRVTDLTLRFLLVLNNKGRLNHLESITASFDLLVQETFGKIEVDIFTPTAIDTQAINTIKEKVHSMLGKEPIMHPYVDRAMLGGIKLRIGDQLIDGSVQTKLRRLSETIKNSGGTAIREQFETYLEDN